MTSPYHLLVLGLLAAAGLAVCKVDEAPSTSLRTRSLLGCAGLGGCLAAIDPGPAVNNYATSTADQFSSAQQSLGTGITDVFKGDPNGALQTLTDAEISATKQQLGSIASAIPGYNKLDPHCNGFVCNAGDVGQDISCDDAFIAQKKDDFCGSLPSDQCDLIKGAKIDYIAEAAATSDIIAGALAGGPAGALEEALSALAREMERQYEAFAANAGTVANDVINSALNSLGTIIESVTQCGLNISLQAKLVTSNGKQCALCLCAPTANAFTPYLAWKVNGGCAVNPTTTPPLVGYG